MDNSERRRLEQDILERRDAWINSDEEKQSELATLRAENAKLAGDLKAAQGIIVDAGKQVEALEAAMHDAIAKSFPNGMSIGTLAWTLTQTRETLQKALQSPAPVVESEAPQVTLTEEEITWLAEAETIEDDCYKSVYRGHPKSLVGKASINSNTHYKLNWTIATLGDYDTPENRTAIEARRKALGLS